MSITNNFHKHHLKTITIVRFKLIWQYREPICCFFYEHRAATSLHKKVGSDRWGWWVTQGVVSSATVAHTIHSTNLI